MAIATNTELKEYGHIPPSDTVDDTLLTKFCNQSQKWFETKTHRIFDASADTTRYFTASLGEHGGHISDDDPLDLILDWDLCAITSITNGDGIVVTSGQYTVKPRNMTPWYAIHLLPSSNVAWTYTSDPENAIAIAGKWGWSQTPPDDVKFGVIRLAWYLYKQRDSGQNIDQITFTPTGAVMLPPTFPKDVADIALSYWRRGFVNGK